MDGRSIDDKVMMHWIGRGGFRRDRLRFRFINQADGGIVQRLQFRLARFVPGKFDHVADGKKFAQTFLLVGQQHGRLPSVRAGIPPSSAPAREN